jgi:hypothetical protein
MRLVPAVAGRSSVTSKEKIIHPAESEIRERTVPCARRCWNLAVLSFRTMKDNEKGKAVPPVQNPGMRDGRADNFFMCENPCEPNVKLGYSHA